MFGVLSMSWADEYLAACQVTDMAKDPDDYRRTVQSAVTVGGVLIPGDEGDRLILEEMFRDYEATFHLYRWGLDGHVKSVPNLTAMMKKMIKRSAKAAKDPPLEFAYISLDPRDYTMFVAPRVESSIIEIHTRPDRCLFLAVLCYDGLAMGETFGRMRVKRPTEQGVYPIEIRTRWRALTNKIKQEKMRHAYQRLINPTV